MTSKLLAIAVAAACLGMVTSAADAKQKRRSVHAPTVYGEPTPSLGFHQEPARMIEIKPGVFVSSYGCVTDEGNGRFLPCGTGRDR